MKRTLISLFTAALVAAFAGTASAATSVSLTPTSTSVVQGGTITLETYVTANGGETDNTVFGAILYTDAVVDPGTRTQTVLPPGDWTTGALSCTTTRCITFSQVRAGGAVAVGLTNSLISTATFTVPISVPIGTVINFSWQTTPSTQRLDWFGITNAAGTSVTVVPEPTTAALLGLGLFGLAVAGRRRA